MSKRAYEQREREEKPLQEILKNDGSELFMANFMVMSEAQATQCLAIMEGWSDCRRGSIPAS